jgi:hypothetical protein
MIALLLVLFAGPIPAPTKPNPTLTPGVTRPLSLHAVCTTRWGKDRRFVTERMKRDVFEAYGIPWTHHALYEVDHLIPRELGGADAEGNLWPERWADPNGARTKDRLENQLHRQVCAKTITLQQAQEAIRSDWLAAWRLYGTTR